MDDTPKPEKLSKKQLWRIMRDVAQMQRDGILESPAAGKANRHKTGEPNRPNDGMPKPQ
ncbi:MAG: hypothetical protein JSS27_05640 [Planctomycetes bacterium]|nr:hypothetical protein [Planctomycetota bacterium]